MRLNRAHAWIIQRPKFINTKTVLATTLPLFLVACSEDLADKDIWFWLKVLFGAWIIYKVMVWMGKHSKGGGDGGCGSACGGCGGCGGGD